MIIIFPIVLFAQGPGGVSFSSGTPDFNFQIPISGLKSLTLCETGSGDSLSCPGIAKYIQVVYTFLVGFATVLAVLAVTWGGIQWLLSRGESSKIQEARKIIGNAIVGLLLTLGSYTILSVINPSLTQFSPLSITPILKIDLPIIAKNMAPGTKGDIARFNAMSCPGSTETEFDAYFTAYYKPPFGEKGGYEDFFCNIGMQCSCPDNDKRNRSRICRNSEGYQWYPCANFTASANYCTATSSGVAPQANYSLAADQTCFKVGCKLEIDGKTYEVHDKGSLIKGRHFDLFVGTSLRNADFTGAKRVKILNPSACF